VAQRNDLRWARPWLDIESAAIDAYVRRHRLRHVDDLSNRQPRFARSRLRSLVWPSLVAAFPEAETALSAAAARAQETSQCLFELAEIDARNCIDAQQRLSLAPWLALSSARRTNLLRHWLQRCMTRGAPQSLVHRLLHECMPVDGARCWPADGGQVIQHRRRLVWRPGRAASSGSADEAVVRLDLSAPGRHAVEGWQGHFVVQPARGAGVPAALLAACELRARQGAERFQFHARSRPRSLKKQFQAAAVPAQARGGPLVFVDGQLVFVPGLGLDARVCQYGSADLRTLAWVGDEA
jgi:tRNA(Ile)-lysidine synthase